jgi:hypothetical protein
MAGRRREDEEENPHLARIANLSGRIFGVFWPIGIGINLFLALS